MKLNYLQLPFFLTFIFLPLINFGQITINQDTTLQLCQGSISDSGGINNSYAPNEDFTLTICPDSSSTHIQLNFQEWNIDEGDILQVHDGISTQDSIIISSTDSIGTIPFTLIASAANSSGCLTISFASDSLLEASGWLAEVSCYTICQSIIAEIDSNIATVCFGDTVLLSGNAVFEENNTYYNQSNEQSTFYWDLGDGNQLIGNNIPYVWDGTGNFLIELSITDQFGCNSANVIEQEIIINSPPNFTINEGLLSPICPGDSLYLFSSLNEIDPNAVISVEPATDITEINNVYEGDSLALPDGTGEYYETSIMVTGFEPGAVLDNINNLKSICLEIEHSWLFDLDINLICPDGTTIILQNQEFTGGEVYLGEPFIEDDFTGGNEPGVGYEYCWTPNATNGTWAEYVTEFGPTTLPSGNYSSFENMENLLGCPLNGEWTLSIGDLWASDNGWIFGWDLFFCDEVEVQDTLAIELIDSYWSDDPSIIFQTSDSICIAPTNSTNYQFNVIDELGCEYSESILVEVAEEVEAIISGDLSFCVGESTTLFATGGMEFLWNTGDTTASINVTDAGTYEVTVTSSEGCSALTSVFIEEIILPEIIIPLDTIYCLDQPALQLPELPMFDLFWEGPGINGFTFDPSAAGIGMHTITYLFSTPEGCEGANSINIEVEICVNTTPDLYSERSISVMPNPNNGNFSLLLQHWKGNKSVQIFNAQGQLLYSTKTAQQQIFFTDLPKGVYIAKVSDQEYTAAQKVIIQ